jgi:hypothetical protein
MNAIDPSRHFGASRRSVQSLSTPTAVPFARQQAAAAAYP